jgi:TorA maturation chaperone TorD
VWRTVRPRSEQGTVNAKSTEALKGLYLDLGLRLRPDEVELADHIAIELEALAYALEASAQPDTAVQLQHRLASWVPTFCGAVARSSRLESYRLLAGLTTECFSDRGARVGHA